VKYWVELRISREEAFDLLAKAALKDVDLGRKFDFTEAVVLALGDGSFSVTIGDEA
jgi:hypothetical protein